jgi:hypothetical protein
VTGKLTKDAGGSMVKDKYSVIMRILDDQNRLTDRADSKAIALLSTLGIFTVFFIAQLSNIKNFTPPAIALLVIYLVSIVLAILHIILAISPRIRTAKNKGQRSSGDVSNLQPTFFGGISQFPDVNTYKKCIEDLVNNEGSVEDTYIRQVYEIARINRTKYKFVGRSVWFVVVALFSQITFIVLMFAHLLGQ